MIDAEVLHGIYTAYHRAHKANLTNLFPMTIQSATHGTFDKLLKSKPYAYYTLAGSRRPSVCNSGYIFSKRAIGWLYSKRKSIKYSGAVSAATLAWVQ
jgi:hypothetical protein